MLRLGKERDDHGQYKEAAGVWGRADLFGPASHACCVVNEGTSSLLSQAASSRQGLVLGRSDNATALAGSQSNAEAAETHSSRVRVAGPKDSLKKVHDYCMPSVDER